MIIKELFDNNIEKKDTLGYDLKDDLSIFMNNDPTFYRKRYFPTMLKFKKYCDEGKSIRPVAFKKLVTDAYEMYKAKFPVEGLQDKLDEEICMEICKGILEQETKNVKEGVYED
jgi:hypothetical protein